MEQRLAIEAAAAKLGVLWKQTQAGQGRLAEAATIAQARDEVFARYQPLFAVERLPKLTEDEFRQFLHFKNNRHWMGLQRMGPAICEDMARLRSALAILLDESRPIGDRLNQLIPAGKPAYVPRLGKAVLTPILLIAHPTKYGVWNRISEAAMSNLELWPSFESGLSFGQRYASVNDIMLKVSEAVGVDLWVLDSLWWAAVVSEGTELTEVTVESEHELPEVLTPQAQHFGLERHLHEFLRDNWDKTSIGKEWMLYEADGEPDAGYEYRTDIGRIDLLARHRKEKRWLVIELKRAQSSDETVGQLLRYMGWVKNKMAHRDEVVEGMIIAHEADDKVRHAISVVPGVTVQLYEVEFRLKPHGRRDFAGDLHARHI